MADTSDDDPDLTLGRRITAGQTGGASSTPVSTEDPDVAAGRAIVQRQQPQAQQPTTTAVDDLGRTITDQPDLSWRGIKASDIIGGAAGLVHNVTKGLSFGLSDPVNALMVSAFPNSGFAKEQQDFNQSRSGFQENHPLLATGAEIAGSLPTYVAGEGALRAAVPVVERTGIVPTVANLGGAAIRNALISGAQAGGMTDGSLADRAAAAAKGAEFGAVAGPVSEVVGGALSPITRGLGGTGGGISAADAQLGNLALNKYGIPITAADLSSNQFLRTAADQAAKIPFSGAATGDVAKRAAWQGAIAREMGEPSATAFTPDVMDAARTRIGNVFNGVAKSTTIDQASTNTLMNDLAKVESDMHMTLPENEIKPIKTQLDNITDIASKGNGTISGDSYQALTRKGAPLDRAESSNDPNVRYVAGQIRDALDDAFTRSASPQDQQALVQAKYQYRVMRTVQDLAAGSRDGSISPDGFMQKVLTASRRFDAPTGGIAYTGGGNIGELARIGKLMRAAPQTGTADRLAINALLLGAPGGLAYLADPTYLASLPATIALNRAGNAALRSQWMARNAVSSALNPTPYAPSVIPGAASAYNALTP